jgi:hypothetical protein
MTVISVNSRTASNRFDAIFAAVIASCADFCAGARQGRDIEGHYHELARRSNLTAGTTEVPCSSPVHRLPPSTLLPVLGSAGTGSFLCDQPR